MTMVAGSLRLGDKVLDCASETLLDSAGASIALRAQSMQVLCVLASRAGEVVSKEDLIAAVWPDTAVTDDSLVQCIADIRRALGPEGRDSLKTVPRKGYMLVADTAGAATVRTPGRGRLLLVAALGIVALIVTGVFALRAPAPDPGGVSPTLSVVDEGGAPALTRDLRATLSRYRSIRLLGDDRGRYRLRLSGGGERVLAELIDGADGAVIHAETVDLSPNNAPDFAAARLAAAIASPMSGAVSKHVFAAARRKPVEELTRAECYVHGYRIQGGQNDYDTARRALACLSTLIDRDPADARALALKGAIHAQQYWWSSGLDEPERSDPALRAHLPGQAIALASRAEALLDTPDSAVYYAMGRAYYSGCAFDQVKVSAERALEINPDDPNLLGAFGNWVAYSGFWDEGETYARRAIEIQPRGYAKWWWWTIGKANWRRGDYEAALAGFMKAYDENNWLNQMQLAYTLPFLDRNTEAARAVARLRELRPGFTRDDAIEAYERWCFDEAWLTKMDDALARAGLPSRAEEARRAAAPPPALYVAADENAAPLARRLRTALSPYRSVQLVKGEESDYRLDLFGTLDNAIAAELSETATGAVLFSREAAPDAATVLAAEIASPLTGAITLHIYEQSRLKPVEALTRAECYAHGFLVSGGNLSDALARRALACLDLILTADPEDARALSLKAGVRSLQYWWSVGLDEPERSEWSRRSFYRDDAVALAVRAEGLPRAPDAAVYQNLVRAYFAGCQPEKARRAAHRGIEVNPDDPTMLGVAGNSLAMMGYWDEGAALTQRAIEMTPANPEKWWWWAPAKANWLRGEHEQALELFRRSFSEGSWLSHLQLAYTYPLISRDGEAAQAVRRIREIAPGFTRDDAIEAYRRWCFGAAYIAKMDEALARAGLPSRAEEARLRTTPSIMALPFADLAGSEQLARLGRGLAEEITADLARNHWLRVIAPRSAETLGADADATQAGRRREARFVLSGALDGDDDRLRISARLTDALGDTVVWSARWTRPATDLFAVQDEILDRIDAALSGAWTDAVAKYSLARAKRRPTDSLEAFDLFQLGIEQKHLFTPAGNLAAIDYFRRATDIDPLYAKAWAGLAIAAANYSASRPTEEQAQWRDRRIAAIRAAMAADPEDPDTLIQESWLRAQQGDFTASERAMRRAAEVAPNNADILAHIAWVGPSRVDIGPDALDWARRAMALNPDWPNWYAMGLGFSAFAIGDDRTALEAFDNAPRMPARYALAAAAAGHLGDEAAMRAALERLRSIAPAFETGVLDYYSAPTLTTRLREGLEIAQRTIDRSGGE